MLKDKIAGKRIILASNSPRRRQLLTDAGIEFVTAGKYECEERYPEGLPAENVAGYLSELKSFGYPRLLGENDILITADTVVTIDGLVLGKPAGRDEALCMLRRLSGRTHTVITGVTLRTRSRKRTFDVRSSVTFRELTDEELEYYVDNFRPYDKAGAYGIQEWIGYTAAERLEGSFYNVMGLPVQRVYTELESFVVGCADDKKCGEE